MSVGPAEAEGLGGVSFRGMEDVGLGTDLSCEGLSCADLSQSMGEGVVVVLVPKARDIERGDLVGGGEIGNALEMITEVSSPDMDSQQPSDSISTFTTGVVDKVRLC